MDQDVVLEALSALTGATVKAGSQGGWKLDVFNLITHVFEKNSSSGLRKVLFVDVHDFFHPKYDYDFRSCNDKSVCMRGNESYSRPLGWYRVALKVLDKYPDGNVWLGTNGWRSHSTAGEWPVSYHGTSIERTTDGRRRGIYSTYDLDEASCYCTEFRSQKTGKNFRVIMQNRINPQMRTACDRKNYWLIEIPPGTSAGVETEIVVKSIRPYGIMLKEI